MTSPSNSNSYTKRDFNSNIAELDRIIRERYPQDWTDFQPGRLGNVIKDLIAHDFDILSFMLDQYARERFPSTMELRESALHFANSVGYEVTAALGASIDLNVTLADIVTEPAIIAKGTTVKSVGGLVFELQGDVVIPAGKNAPESFVVPTLVSRTASLELGSNTVTFHSYLPDQVSVGHFLRMNTTSKDYQISFISADRLSALISENSQDADMLELEYSIVNKQVTFMQGETKSETTVSTGSADIIIATRMENSLEGSIVVTIDDVPWTRVDAISQELNINVFSVRYDAEDAPIISFGNGITGNIPPEDSIIKITARVGVGITGNIAAGSINTVSKATVGSEEVTVLVSNPVTEGSGGADRPTVAEITAAVPAYIKSNDTAVTQEDYNTLSTGYSDSLYGRIEKAVTVLSTNFVPYEMNLVKIYAWSSDGAGALVPPSDGLRSSLKTFLNERKMIGTEIYILDGLNKTINLTLDLTFSVTKSKDTVKSQIENAIDSLFTSTFVTPGKPLFLSKVYEVVEAIEGVETVYVSANPEFVNGAVPASNVEMIRLGTLEMREAPEAPPFAVAPITSVDGTAHIQWGLVGDAVSYEVEISDHPTYSSTTSVGSFTQNLATVTGLDNGIYYFRVRSVNVSGVSEWKNATNPTQVILS